MPLWIPQVDEDKGEPIYRQIVQALNDDIAAGRLAAGARLPPHRELADELLVARGTVAQAYREAESLGLVRSDVGRGTYVLGLDSEASSYASLIEKPVIQGDLTTNHPLTNIDPDPADALRELANRPDRKALLRYQSNQGIPRHRTTGAAWARRYGIVANHERVLVCAGAQHALFVALAHLTEPGSAVLVEEWSYPGLTAIAETLRLRLVPVGMDEHGLCPDSLLRVLRRDRARVLYLMPTLHNPLGIVMPEERRARLCELIRQRELVVLEDAAHQLLEPNPPRPLSARVPERGYFVASTSKILCPGLRVAYLICPEDQCERVARQIWATQWMVSPIGPEVVSLWIERGVADRTLRAKRKEARRRQKLARRVLADFTLLANHNALHLWLTLPEGCSADQIASRARQQNIGVTPSSAFWMRSTKTPARLRIALGGIDDSAELDEALERLVSLIRANSATRRTNQQENWATNTPIARLVRKKT